MPIFEQIMGEQNIQILTSEEVVIFKEKLSKMAQAQLRCGKSKKITKLVDHGEKKVIIKGPYENGEKKLFMNVVFTWLLGFMEGPAILDLDMKDKSSLPIEKLIVLPEQGEIYLQF